MNVFGVSPTGSAHADHLGHDRSIVSDIALRAFRIAAVFSTVISASIFLHTGLPGAAMWCGISLICSIVSLSTEGRSHRRSHVIHNIADPILIFENRQPQFPNYRAVNTIQTHSYGSNYGYGYGYGFQAPAAPAPQPQRGFFGRDVVGSRNMQSMAAAAFAAHGRDVVGSRRRY